VAGLRRGPGVPAGPDRRPRGGREGVSGRGRLGSTSGSACPPRRRFRSRTACRN